jgi:hypothetical protein
MKAAHDNDPGLPIMAADRFGGFAGRGRLKIERSKAGRFDRLRSARAS